MIDELDLDQPLVQLSAIQFFSKLCLADDSYARLQLRLYPWLPLR